MYLTLLLLALLAHRAQAFQPAIPQHHSVTLTKRRTILQSSGTDQVEVHPAVAGWPDKYAGSSSSKDDSVGPRVLHDTFTVEKAKPSQLQELDVTNWPTWSTANNPKWVVGNQNRDKIMPYGELSYVLSGKLEIIIPSDANGDDGDPVLVEEGDFVTFPEGFQSHWKVLEELTWHYYLY